MQTTDTAYNIVFNGIEIKI